MDLDSSRQLQLDRESRGSRYYRNAVERHWDPWDIDLEEDRRRVAAFLREDDHSDVFIDQFRQSIARFGAGEQAVTEDLAPLSIALDNIDDQLFITTQLYEEGKHTDFFDRYWREVIHHAEDEHGLERSSPTSDTWFNDDYVELFARNEQAMARLLEDPTPEDFARAYSHYHLVIEGILAQTGYFGLQSSFSEEQYPELPHLPGLYEGFSLIRQDEGRHIGFGMAKLKALITEADVDPQLLDDTVTELMPLVDGITVYEDERSLDRGIDPDDLREFATEKHVERMRQIRDADEEIPSVETLTQLEGVSR